MHILLIIFLGLLAYSNTFDAPFQFDDLMFVEYSQTVSQAAKAASGLQTGKEASDIVSLPVEIYKGPWASRPLFYATFMLNRLMGGFNTWGYHAVNIALHLANGLLLYFLVIMTGRNLGYKEDDTVPVALLSSLIFVLHPVQTESVTNIVNRSMLMATTFYLAGLILFLKIAISENSKNRFYTACLVVTALLGAASREDFATFPIMLFIYDLFFISRFRPREVARHYRGYLAVIPGIALMCYLVLANTYDTIRESSQTSLPQDLLIPPLQYALTQLKIHWTYIRLFLLPINQSIDYSYPVSTTLDFTTALSFLGYAGLLVCGLLYAKKRPVASFGIFWFLAALLPISFGIALMGLRLGDPLFEHRMYLPSVGLTVLMAITLVSLVRRRKVLVLAIVAICVSFGGAAYARNYVWTDESRLWGDAVAKSPNSPRAHNNLATYFYERRFYDEAIEHLEKAIRYWPENSDFHANLGSIYLKKGDIDKSIGYLETAVELTPTNLFAHETLGEAYMTTKQYEKALEQFLAAAKLAPWDTSPLNDAAGACYALGRKDEAIKHYLTSLWIDREQVDVLHNISVLYMETGQTKRAIEHLEALVSFVPGHIPARLALGKIYMEEDQPLEAVRHLREALKYSPDSADVHRTIARAYREVGNTQSADEHLKRAEALEKARVSNDPATH